tara:strand:- start:270 stop:899 length:630 start_codon:yes stop_codon:yes gene_type:complete
MIEKEKINFSLVKGDLKELNKKKILELLRRENNQSILAKLSDKIVFDYLDIVQNSNFLKLFCLEYNNEVIAYAITSAKPEYLISEFKNLKAKIFLSLVLNLKIITLLNILISILNLDLIFFKKENLNKIKESPNLNLIAVENKYQSKGIGSLFLQKIISHYKEIEKSEYMTCETYSQRAIKFYLDKCGFRIIGKKIRVPKNLYVLEHKF